ncbi:long-chain-fatty-acid--CoA ligase 4 [Galendromus occidentalis]|uniref:long-chain-fatty-acid--CoA ligase n=1 Tax=Galendromus occidentalis TaxID=34638 RepID=A0AAJ7SFI2_9ACAR|nr:long-chain-fatty-acid--CoA ligase 4 [Galendromus occidentalis]
MEQNGDLVYSRPLKGAPEWGPLKRTHHRIDLETFDGIKTVDQLMRRVFSEFPDTKGIGTRQQLGEDNQAQADGRVFKKLVLGEYEWITYRKYEAKVELVGRGLLSLGLRPKQNVCVLAETRMEWMLTAQACFRNNFPLVTLYSNLGDDGLIHGLNETEITHLVTTSELLPKILSFIESVPRINTIIYMECPYKKTPKPAAPREGLRLIPFSQLEDLGKSADPALVGGEAQSEDAAIIMYTSGSTGVPKAVIITNNNILATAKGFQTALCQLRADDTYIAYLPLAHIFEITVELTCIAKGMRIGYSSPLTLTDKSTAIREGDLGDARVLKPHIISCVPLVLDRIRKSVIEGAAQKGIVFKTFIEFAISYKLWWTSWGFNTPILNRLIFKKVKSIVGGNLQVITAGSAPLSADTHSFIKACLDVSLLQGYGLTETTAGATLMEVSDRSVGRVGPPLYGDVVKLIDWTEGNYSVKDKPFPRGEILVGGATVTKGYYKNEKLTAETFVTGEDGIRWLYTGDVAELHPDGTLKIIDRKKDLVKLQFGEYISLGKVESELKTCPLVENICVYGNSFQTFLIALISPNESALDQLAASLGKRKCTFTEICRDQDIVRAVTELITNHGKKCKLQKMEIPTKVKLCSEQWLPDTGLVTAALKIRRNIIQDFYRSDIDRMYAESE